MNFVDTYIDYATEFTDTPEIFHRFVGYWLLSCAVNRSAWLAQGHQKIYPNVWIVLIAPSGFYHKSYAMSIGQDILERAYPEMVWPNEFSHEKLIDILSKKPIGTFVYDEFSGLLSQFNREYSAGAKGLLTTLYDSKVYRRVVGIQQERSYELRDTFVNIISASTVDWILKSMTTSDALGGFLPRFLFVPGTDRTKVLAFQPVNDQMKLNALVSGMVEKGNKAALTGEMKYSDEARQAFEAWYGVFVKRGEASSNEAQPFLVRMIYYCHKLAILIAIDEGEGSVIELKHFKKASLLIDLLARQIEKSLTNRFDTSFLANKKNKIIDIMRRYPEKHVPRNYILRYSNITIKELQAVEDTMRESDLIDVSSAQNPKNGRLQYFWSLNGNSLS